MDGFSTGGISHIVAVVATFIIGFMMVRFMRSDASETNKKRVRTILGWILIATVFIDIPLIFLRWGNTATAWHEFWSISLPFYLCDAVAIIGAFALFTKNRTLTEITYLWAITGTTQGLITPDLTFDWNAPEYYSFFLQHSGAPIAAITLMWGLKIYPAKGAFKRIVYCSWIYMAITIAVNFLINQNYGFLRAKPDFPSMLDYMGAYPYYLITLQVVAFSVYYLLLRVAPKHEEELKVKTVKRSA